MQWRALALTLVLPLLVPLAQALVLAHLARAALRRQAGLCVGELSTEHDSAGLVCSGGEPGAGVSHAHRPTIYHGMYFERHQLEFCQVHDLNNVVGTGLLTGEALLQHCAQLQAANPVWAHAFTPGAGRFSLYAVNHWLFNCTPSGRVLMKFADLAREQAADVLQRMQYEGHQAAVVQLAWEHAVALRYCKRKVSWYVMDSEHTTPVEYQPGMLDGVAYVMRRVDAESEFLLPGMCCNVEQAQLFQLMLPGPVPHYDTDLEVVNWLQSHPVPQLATLAGCARHVHVASTSCTKLLLAQSVVTDLLPTAQHVGAV